VRGGPAWSFDATRKQFYLHQFQANQPDLNLKNDAVLFELRVSLILMLFGKNVMNYLLLQKVLRFWRGQGVSGFLFKDASYLVEDGDFKDEPALGEPSDKTFTDYEFYKHTYTKNLPENVDVLAVFKSELLSEMDDPEGKM
jgi:alpha-glucosidase